MVKTLNVIVDTSGSMDEMGKIHLQRNLCRYAAQLSILYKEKYKDVDIRLFQWSHNVLEINLQDDGDVPALRASGSADLSALSDFILQCARKTQKWDGIILTDGGFPESDISSYKEKVKSIAANILAVAVGADANHRELREISTCGGCYRAEDISAAIDRVVFDIKDTTVPNHINQVLFDYARCKTDEEDNWGG